MKFIEKFTQKALPTPLGRWNLDYCSKKISEKTKRSKVQPPACAILEKKWCKTLAVNGCSSVLERMPYNQKVELSNPAVCWAFLSSHSNLVACV